jgi:hypothetical protein
LAAPWSASPQEVPAPDAGRPPVWFLRPRCRPGLSRQDVRPSEARRDGRASPPLHLTVVAVPRIVTLFRPVDNELDTKPGTTVDLCLLLRNLLSQPTSPTRRPPRQTRRDAASTRLADSCRTPTPPAAEPSQGGIRPNAKPNNAFSGAKHKARSPQLPFRLGQSQNENSPAERRAAWKTWQGCRRERSGVRPLRQPEDYHTKSPARNESPDFANLAPTLPSRLGRMSGQIHASTNRMSVASTASSGATLPSSASRQASSASIRRSVASGGDFLASTAI